MAIEAVPPVTYVGLRVTELCNASPACISRCFSREQDQQGDSSIGTVIDILQRLQEGGVETVNVMGGEPTLRKDLPYILKKARELGLQTVLSTNAISLTSEQLDGLEPLLTWLSVSLDADSQRLNDALRGKGQWEAALQIRDWFKGGQRRVGLKVNTQVNAVNIDHIAGIPRTLGSEVGVWKLLQWTPRAEAAKVIDRYAVTPEQYAHVVEQMRIQYPNQKIVERPYPEAEPDTGIVRPDGTFEINAGPYSYEVIGNLLTENPNDVLQRAALKHQQLSLSNWTEYNESYPQLWKEVL